MVWTSGRRWIALATTSVGVTVLTVAAMTTVPATASFGDAATSAQVTNPRTDYHRRGILLLHRLRLPRPLNWPDGIVGTVCGSATRSEPNRSTSRSPAPL